MASAAGWIDADRLLLATQTGLAVLDLRDGGLRDLIAVEADDPGTRSNDGRADRQGGFWFSTMGLGAEAARGAIYRFHRGEVRQVRAGVTIPNAICFAPDGRLAYFADTALQCLWAQPLDAQGWPEGEAALFLDLAPEGLNPDGAVVDAQGGLIVSLWGGGRVHRYDAQARLRDAISVPALHTTCPALGGADLRDLLVTSALQDIADPDPLQGLPYLLRAPFAGIPEPQVIL